MAKKVVSARLFKGKGKLRGRYCVEVTFDKAPKSAVRGVKLAPHEFHGCYVSKVKAEKVKNRFEAKARK